VEVLKLVEKDYDKFSDKSEILREENLNKFTLEKMKEKFLEILKPYFIEAPKQKEIVLPKLNKIK
jgi:hypothetical protein